MTVEKVDAIPKKTSCFRSRSTFSAMRRKINVIMDAGCKYGKITFESDEYESSWLGYQSLRNHVISNNLPIEFALRGQDLYFTRLDMKD